MGTLNTLIRLNHNMPESSDHADFPVALGERVARRQILRELWQQQFQHATLETKTDLEKVIALLKSLALPFPMAHDSYVQLAVLMRTLSDVETQLSEEDKHRIDNLTNNWGKERKQHLQVNMEWARAVRAVEELCYDQHGIFKDNQLCLLREGLKCLQNIKSVVLAHPAERQLAADIHAILAQKMVIKASKPEELSDVCRQGLEYSDRNTTLLLCKAQLMEAKGDLGLASVYADIGVLVIERGQADKTRYSPDASTKLRHIQESLVSQLHIVDHPSVPCSILDKPLKQGFLNDRETTQIRGAPTQRPASSGENYQEDRYRPLKEAVQNSPPSPSKEEELNERLTQLFGPHSEIWPRNLVSPGKQDAASADVIQKRITNCTAEGAHAESEKQLVSSSRQPQSVPGSSRDCAGLHAAAAMEYKAKAGKKPENEAAFADSEKEKVRCTANAPRLPQKNKLPPRIGGA